MSPMPEADYRAHASLSYHDAQDFARCPWLFYSRKVMGRQRPTMGYHIFGQAQHCLTLEGPAAFAERFIFPPEEFITEGGAVSKSKAALAWKSEQEGKTIISPNDYALLATLAERTRKNPHAAALLSGAEVEVCRFKDHACGRPLKGRADGVKPLVGGFDLKGCADFDKVAEDIKTYHYVDQLAWYEALFGVPFRHLIFSEKVEPYRVGVWVVSATDIAVAMQRNDALIARIHAAYEADSWPCDPLEIQAYESV